MTWNWQLPDWPKFSYNPDRIAEQEKQFLLKAGSSFALIKKMIKVLKDFKGALAQKNTFQSQKRRDPLLPAILQNLSNWELL